MRVLFPFLSACALFATPAFAGSLVVQVQQGSKGIADAVVTLHAAGRSMPPRPAGPYVIEQKNIQFHPFVSVVPAGADVFFPNLDAVRHHVYSFSPAKRFELKLYAKDQSRSVHFDQPGIIALGCNIHDSMSAFIFVTDTAWTAKTDKNGRAVLSGLPADTYTMSVWHPYLRAPGNQLSSSVALTAADRRETVNVALRAAPMHDMSGY